MKKKIKNHKHYLSDNDEIDLSDIISFVKKNLLILFSVIPICLAISLIYHKNLEKFFKTSLLIRPPDIIQFSRFYLTDYDKNDFEYYYNKFLNELVIYIDSQQNFKNFLLENKSDFSIKEIDKINIIYEGKKFQKPLDADVIGSIYTIKYSSDTDGYKIITSYIENSIQKVKKNFNSEAIANIDNHILKLKNDLDIARGLGIFRPFNTTKEAQFLRNHDYPTSAFFLGTEVIQKKIKEIELKRRFLETNNFNYKAFFNEIYDHKPSDNNLIKFLLSGLAIGIFLSSIIIFLRTKKYKNN